MKELWYFESLPDVMTVADLLREIDELLANSNAQDRMNAVDALCQLSDRYWHTYEDLPAAQKENVSSWIESYWLPVDLRFIEACGCIIGHLGLPGALEFISQQRRNARLPSDCAAEIDQLTAELADSVAATYRSLRKLSPPNSKADNP